MLEAIFEFLDGRRYTLDGISGVLRFDSFKPKYGATKNTLRHIPDAAGKKTELYHKLKSEMGDDWTTDLTNSDRLIPIAIELGYKEQEETVAA